MITAESSQLCWHPVFYGSTKKTKATSDTSASMKKNSDTEVGINFQFSSLDCCLIISASLWFFPVIKHVKVEVWDVSTCLPKKIKTTLWPRSLVSVTEKPHTCWTVASSTPALRNSAKIAFKKICSCNEAFLSQKTKQTKIHLWSSEPMKHQDKVWKGNCLAATYLNTGWAVYVTSVHCITACNSGITILFLKN